MSDEKNPFFGSTFAERKAIREAAENADDKEAKAVHVDSDEVEDKAVSPKKTARKSTTRKSAAKKKS